MNLVGNDIVDLQNISTHPRFPQRICAEEEIDFLHEAPHHLWILWTVKEATYKVIKKLDSSALFSPKKFIYQPSVSTCHYKHLSIPISTTLTAEYVHSIAALGNSHKLIAKVGVSRSTPESLAVRALGEEMLEAVGYSQCKIEGRPPHVLQNGKHLSALDVSLSHDGRYIAVALCSV